LKNDFLGQDKKMKENQYFFNKLSKLMQTGIFYGLGKGTTGGAVFTGVVRKINCNYSESCEIEVWL
jgi:hypothetical protein